MDNVLSFIVNHSSLIISGTSIIITAVRCDNAPREPLYMQLYSSEIQHINEKTN